MVKSIEAVVFDLYGTLAYIANNTKPYHRLLREMQPTPDEARMASVLALTEDFHSFSDFIRKIRRGALVDIQSYEKEIAQEVASVKLFPDTIPTLKRVKDNDISIGLISNLASPYVKPFFDLGLDKYVDIPLFSCHAGLRKPDSRIYDLMLSSFGVDPSRVLIVGDNPNSDVSVPKSLGMQSILLDRSNKSNYSPRISSLLGIFYVYDIV
jgi:HAD superfamily hydrolase (TIGR01549 family)